MKKIFLLGALVASTMAFASMESNSVLDTLKSGSVTVKGGLIFDGNSTASTTYKDDTTVEEGLKPDYNKVKAEKNYGNVESKSLPSVGLGLEVEYSMPVYKINDDMAVLVAGGLQGGAEYASIAKSYKTYNYVAGKTTRKDKFAEKDENSKSNYVVTNLGVFVAPKFEYKLNDEMKVAAGVKLGLGAEIHTRLANNTSLKSIEKTNINLKNKESNAIEFGKFNAPKDSPSADDTKQQTYEKNALDMATLYSKSETNTTFAVPVAAIVDFDYNNIVASLDLGGKVLFANDKDNFSYNKTADLKYTKAVTTPEPGTPSKVEAENEKMSSKFIFSAGLKVGYRFDLDKFMK